MTRRSKRLSNQLVIANAVADSLDLTIPEVQADPARSLMDFARLAGSSSEYQKLQHMTLAQFSEGGSMEDLADNLFGTVTRCLWLGWEAGRNSIIREHLERMALLKDKRKKQIKEV